MVEESWVKELLIVLATAGVVVPLFGRLRFGVVPGFLIVGVILGPGGLGKLVGDAPWLHYVTFSDPERVQPFAELGVLVLLFLIGLEFSVDRLWRMRKTVLGLGPGQVLLSAAFIIGGALWLSGSWTVAIVVGMALALSSTAIVTQTLIESHRIGMPVGQVALGVLIFQDLMVVPIVIIVGLLGGDEPALSAAVITGIALSIAALVVILVLGRFLVGPLLKAAASTGSRELIVAIALFIAIGTAVLTATAGLSMALGAFLAGLLLGGSEYRHQIEVDIEPFKGLFLGLFFMTVGMSLDLGTLAENAGAVAIGFAGLLAAKALATFAVARALRISTPVALEAAILLAGAGEFGFIVFTLAGRDSLLPGSIGAIVVSAAALSMIATPALAALGRRIGDTAARRGHQAKAGVGEAADEALADHVVIGGFGRVGETVARMLVAEEIPYVALDLDGDLVAGHRKARRNVFFGDASRREILEKIGGGSARCFVVTTDEPDAAERMVQAIREAWPAAPIHARAIDAEHARRLRAAGATDVVPEALEGSLQLAGRVLEELGLPDDAVDARIDAARARAIGEMGERD
jgi:CPA2 family monovalent cation:H+ antiporter-2